MIRIELPYYKEAHNEWVKWYDRAQLSERYDGHLFNNFLEFKYQKSKYRWIFINWYYKEDGENDNETIEHYYEDKSRKIFRFGFNDPNDALLFKLRFG